MKSPSKAIPNLDNLYKTLREFVKANQGEKGYIDTQDKTLDTIYSIDYNYQIECPFEIKVMAVRVVEDEIQILTEPLASSYSMQLSEDDILAGDWKELRSVDYYSNTLLQIAENIETFCDASVDDEPEEEKKQDEPMIHFYGFYKQVGDHASRRYFRSFKTAEAALKKDIEDNEKSGQRVTGRRHEFNAEKGIYIYEDTGMTSDGKEIIWAIIDYYFEDHLIESWNTSTK